MLAIDSPAVDTGSGSDAPATDQRGFPRPQASGYDIGAVERQPWDSGASLLPSLHLPLIMR